MLPCPRLQHFLAAYLLSLTFGCGDDSSGPSKPPSGGSGGDAGAAGEVDGGAAGDANGGAAGACEPQTCKDLVLDCGLLDDGCGHTLHCGDACGQGGGGGDGTGSCNPDEVITTRATNARHAASSGYAGTDDAYLALFDVGCVSSSDCTTSCSEAGGSETLCAASECLPNGQAVDQCVPAPVWDNLTTIATDDAALDDMCQLVLVNTTYRDQLLADQFGLAIPDDALIRGITVEVRRAGDDSVADDSVRIIKGGQIGSAEHALPTAWSSDVTWVGYGGPTDLWGEDWAPSDLNDPDFGVAFSAAYSKNVGNTVAYVDAVRISVTYERTCN